VCMYVCMCVCDTSERVLIGVVCTECLLAVCMCVCMCVIRLREY